MAVEAGADRDELTRQAREWTKERKKLMLKVALVAKKD